MDKGLFLMIGALTSNLHHNHIRTPLRQQLHEFLCGILETDWFSRLSRTCAVSTVHDEVDALPIGVHCQIIANEIEDEFVDIVVNGLDAPGRHDALLPGAGMSAGGVVYEGHQLMDFQVDPAGVALGAQW